MLTFYLMKVVLDVSAQFTCQECDRVFQVVLQNVAEPLVIIQGVVVVVKMGDEGLASDGPISKVEINDN